MKEVYSYVIKYKRFIVQILLGLSSVVMIFWVIFPEISWISNELSEIKSRSEVASTLKQSLSVISSAPDEALDDNFNTAVHALPPGKDVVLIFSALSSAAAASNTTLEDFSLTVGGIYGRAAKVISGVGSAPSVDVSAHVGGASPESLIDFARALSQKLPLSEVSKINISGSGASYQVSFFYKPYDTSQMAKQDKVALPPQSDLNLLNQLKGWDQ